jgi:hypothetical protein
MSLTAAYLVYRVCTLEYFLFKTGYYLVEWVGAKKQGRVMPRAMR